MRKNIKNLTRILGFHIEILNDELDAMKEKFDDKKEQIERIQILVKGLKENA